MTHRLPIGTELMLRTGERVRVTSREMYGPRVMTGLQYLTGDAAGHTIRLTAHELEANSLLGYWQ